MLLEVLQACGIQPLPKRSVLGDCDGERSGPAEIACLRSLGQTNHQQRLSAQRMERAGSPNPWHR
jgi:hypothetical protein